MKKIFFLLLVIFSFPSIAALFYPGFFQSDDGEWMIIRFSAFYQALADGQFPVRWLGRLNHEYGYPVANFLYPGFMYIGIPIKLVGFGFVDTIKIILGLSMITSAIFTYLWLSKIFSKWPSFVGSIVYLYAPYHLLDLYKRGSVGEVLALAVVPFIFWQLERMSIVLSSIGISVLVLSHNILALLFLPIIVVYMVLKLFKEKFRWPLIRWYTSVLVFGLGLSAFFWIPALFDLQYTVFFQTKVSEWQNYFANLSLVGISSVAVLGVTLFFLIRSRTFIPQNSNDQNHKNNTLTFFMFGIGVVGIFLSLQVSTPLWKFLPVSFVQFPFRFLSIVVLSTAFLSAFLLSRIKESPKIAAAIFLLLFISALPYIRPSTFFDKGEGFYATNMDTTTVKNEYMPRWVKKLPIERAENKIISSEGSIENIKIQTNDVSFTINTKDKTVVGINTVYFPGWNATINGVKKELSYSNERGAIEIAVPPGNHDVQIKLSETPVRLLSDGLSFVGILGVLLYGLKTLAIKRKHD